MTPRRALLLGGTGMLSRCAGTLVADGWRVVVPSRRYMPLAVDGPGRLRWVEADWADPDKVAERAALALGGPADLLVAWVHGHAREPILRAVESLLAPGAPVVEVHGGSSADPVAGCPDPVIDHPTQQVVLRMVNEWGSDRWLTEDEIAAGVHDAIERALSGRVSGVHQVGGVRVG